MATQSGYYAIVGHAGTVTVGGSSVECQIVTLEVSHQWDEIELKNATGVVDGLDARNERLAGRLTMRLKKSGTAPAVPAVPAPFAAIVLAGFTVAVSPGTTAGRSYVNGNYIYKGNWAPRYAEGVPLEISCDIWQGELIPTQ